jgi:hypothetical protein
VLHALFVLCAVVGGAVLYCGLMAAVWTLFVRLVRQRGVSRTRRREAAAEMPVAAPRPVPVVAGMPGREARATSWAEMPAWLSRDRPWAVAVVLLGAPGIGDRTAEYVDFPGRNIDWGGLLAASADWPPDQRLLVLTAYELAFDTAAQVESALEPVTLQDMVRLLDDDEVERIRVAMDVRRGRVEPDEALTQLDR